MRRAPPPVARLAAAVLGGYVSIGAAIQVLPAAVDDRFGGSEWAVGVAVTAASVAAVVARPLAGRRADERGPRAVVLLGAALAAAGALAQMLAPSLPALVAARLLVGAGEGALFTAALAWVLAAAPAERRGRIVGHFGLSMWGGLAAGPPLAALLAAAAGTNAVWWACLLLPLPPALALLGVAAPRPHEPASNGTRPAAPVRRASLPWRAVARPAVALALASFGYGTLNAFVVLRFADAGFAGAGLALGVFGAAFLLTRAFGSRLADRIAAARLVGGCAVVEATGLAAIAGAPAGGVAFAGIALCGSGTALVYPALTALVAGRVAPARRGAAVGALTSSWDAGLALAGPLGGALVPAAGLSAPFLLAAAAVAAVAPVMRSGARSRRVARSRPGRRLPAPGTAAGSSPRPRPRACR